MWGSVDDLPLERGDVAGDLALKGALELVDVGVDVQEELDGIRPAPRR